VDLGCSYGWFVKHFSDLGYDSLGVDLDGPALEVGRRIYGLPTARLHSAELPSFLAKGQVHDIVTMFSVLHHFALRPEQMTPEELIRAVDRITGSVLFLDTGQAHEQWFRETLPQWNEEFIVDWIMKNTSFTHVVALGIDIDNAGMFRDNYRRTLFACFRS
jgi:2-polyprenyl-3-methyl-5-hydroxy-6-metoxy-1,4-benzoquinol methylase